MLLPGLMLATAGCASPPATAPAPIRTVENPCPPWMNYPVDQHSNVDSPYLGCVSVANLRAMVADKADLDGGKPLGPASGEVATLAVEAFEQGKVKGFQGASASGSTSAQGGSSTSGSSGSQ